nr:Bm1682, isoform c [Brugia malayi]
MSVDYHRDSTRCAICHLLRIILSSLSIKS